MLRRIDIFKHKADHKDQLAANLEEARAQLKSRHTDTPDPHYYNEGSRSRSLVLPPGNRQDDGSHFEGDGSSRSAIKHGDDDDDDAAEGWDWYEGEDSLGYG